MWWIIVLVVLALLAAAWFYFCYMVFNAFLKRNADIYQDDAIDMSNLPELTERYTEGTKWPKETPGVPLTIRSFDGLKLVGKYIPAEGEARRTIILVHGWHSVYF